MVSRTSMSLVKVWTEVDEKCQSLPAKIVSKKGNVFKIKYLSPTEERDQKNRRIYKYEDEIYEVSDESITEYLDSGTELDFGFQEIDKEQFVKCDYDVYSDEDDEDYVPSSEEEDDDEDEDEEDEDEDASLEEYEDDETFSD